MSGTSGTRLLALLALFIAACAGSTPAPAPPSGHADRIAAIEAQITAAQNPDVGFVVFEDASDKAKDGISRIVQLAGGATHIEVLCDAPHHQCEDSATQSLITKLGFTPLNKYNGAYQKDDAKTTPHASALLTEQLFLQVLKASPEYQLTYYNQVQQSPTPLPVKSG
ncbi:MAG TPA: hypothetical protein VF160_09325 [Candidatus Dormibacteraeota bacterium]